MLPSTPFLLRVPPKIIPAGGGGGFAITAASVSGTPAAQAHGFSGTAITFANMNGGVNFGAGKVVIGFVNDQGVDPTSSTIGGTALTKIVDDGNLKVSLWFADVSAGNGDSYVISGNPGSFGPVGAVCWFITGAHAGTATATGVSAYGSSADPQSATLTIPAGGGAVGLLGSSNNVSSTTQTVTWTNTTAGAGDMITRINPGLIIAGAHSSNNGSTAITGTGAGGNFNFIAGLALAAFGP